MAIMAMRAAPSVRLTGCDLRCSWCDTPYAFHDGTVGLYFMGFCRSQAPLRERMNMMYNVDGTGIRDQLTDYSNPASGSFYFAPSQEDLNSMIA